MNRKTVLSVIGVIVLIIAISGISYAMFIFAGTGTRDNVINVGQISINYRENTLISLDGAYPMSDIAGINANNDDADMTFDISSNTSGNQVINYAISIYDINEDTTLKDEHIKIYVLKNNTLVSGFETNVGKGINEFEPYYIEGQVDNYVILTDTISGNEINSYKIISWVSSDYNLPITDTSSGDTHSNETTSETFSFKIKVVATDAPLVISEDLISPVITDINMYLVEDPITMGEFDNSIKRLASPNRRRLTNEKLRRNDLLEIDVIYSKEVTGVAPALTLKFGLNDMTGEVTNGVIDGNTITYQYRVQDGDNGATNVKSIAHGGIRDIRGNVALSTIATSIQDILGKIGSDTIEPTVDLFYIGGNTNPTYVATTATTLYLTYSDLDVESYCIANTNTSEGCIWLPAPSSPINIPYTLEATNGTKTLHAYIKDETGNISEVKPDTTVLDTVGPTISEFKHTGGGNISLTATDSLSNLNSVCINTSATGEGCSYVSYTSGTYQKTLTTSNTYFAHVKDNAGNVTHSVALSVVINSDTSGANKPELATGMIPVYYDGTVWRKADNNNGAGTYRWYSYASSGATKGMWANAVTVNVSNATIKNKYFNSDMSIKVANGTEISMSDINTMWVWIPRFNVNTGGLTTQAYFNSIRGTSAADSWGNTYYPNPGAINVAFVNTSTVALDAFTFDGAKAGFWYGKFETSHSTLSLSTTNNNLGCSNETCSNANGIVIKPSISQLRYNNISNFFYASRSMEQTNNSFGFIASEVDTHLSKNNEWGAVAYLTQSIYGRCSNSTTCDEITINNCNTYKTGIGGDTVSASSSRTTCTTAVNQYNGGKGILASTTGTIYGIYDMNGGANEYVMGNYNNQVTISYSGFNSIPNSKYYNLYTGIHGDGSDTYYGHALNETAKWYGDVFEFNSYNYPWFVRGGVSTGSSGVGIFYFDKEEGTADYAITTRFALVK